MKITTKKIATIGMLCALAYVAMALIHVKLIPAAPFLTYDPKDVIIAIGGFLYGPLCGVIMSLVVSFLEMITISESGIIGFVMQVIATCAFMIPSAVFYKHNRTKKSASIGLAIGTGCMVVIMVLWNYILTPVYMGTQRSDVAAMLVPVIIPFNLIKGVLNSILTILIYKPIVKALRKMGMVQER
ncbi:MAG: ECF transporter S component [Lachnospiraceae bacterium]|nr:ECF transporter S component [Lachnospiraceae bacterium]